MIGYPTPTVNWYKDEIEITENPRYTIGYDRNNGTISLMIKNVAPSDEGCYQCRARNSEGSATTTAYLIVRGEGFIMLFIIYVIYYFQNDLDILTFLFWCQLYHFDHGVMKRVAAYVRHETQRRVLYYHHLIYAVVQLACIFWNDLDLDLFPGSWVLR